MTSFIWNSLSTSEFLFTLSQVSHSSWSGIAFPLSIGLQTQDLHGLHTGISILYPLASVNSLLLFKLLPSPPTVSLFPAFLSPHQLQYLLWFCFGFIWLFLFFMLFRYPPYCRYGLHHHLGFPVPFLQASDRVLFHQLQQHDAKPSHHGKHNYLSSTDPRLAAQESLKFSTVKI